MKKSTNYVLTIQKLISNQVKSGGAQRIALRRSMFDL